MFFQECICFSLGEEDDILISRLAEKVALDKSTLTGILDRLERDGLVNRVSRPEDRRSLYAGAQLRLICDQCIKKFDHR